VRAPMTRVCTACEHEGPLTPIAISEQPGYVLLTCPRCGVTDEYPPQPVGEVARLIVGGGAFRDEDAVRVARAYLEAVA
jgi:hypothetical protein